MARQKHVDIGRAPWRALALAVAVFGLAGCAASDEAAQVPGADAPYPNLATVPARPQPSTTAEERRRIVEELIAEREAARETDRALRAESVDETATQ